VIAITQGHIAAVNLMDAEEGRVYVFNNIFFSRAVDMKDTFKVSITHALGIRLLVEDCD
jgi:hypothetical protein